MAAMAQWLIKRAAAIWLGAQWRRKYRNLWRNTTVNMAGGIGRRSGLALNEAKEGVMANGWRPAGCAAETVMAAARRKKWPSREAAINIQAGFIG